MPALIIAIDGTWRRACTIASVSDIDAVLVVEGPITGLSLKEFFLSLSSFGVAYRRCELDHVNGDQLKVRFLRAKGKRA